MLAEAATVSGSYRPEAASRGSLKNQRRFCEPAAGQIMPLGLAVALMTASSSTTV